MDGYVDAGWGGEWIRTFILVLYGAVLLLAQFYTSVRKAYITHSNWLFGQHHHQLIEHNFYFTHIKNSIVCYWMRKASFFIHPSSYKCENSSGLEIRSGYNVKLNIQRSNMPFINFKTLSPPPSLWCWMFKECSIWYSIPGDQIRSMKCRSHNLKMIILIARSSI